MIPAVAVLLMLGTADPVSPHPTRWSADGHQIVCQIAWERLTTSARAEAARLLELDPEYDSFAMACVWADDIRFRIREGQQEVLRFAPYTPSHYMNTPAGSPGVDLANCTAKGADGTPEPCVVDAIAEFTDSLAHSSDDQRRLEALKFLGHFVGDVHQPLHAGYGEDLGGNRVDVSLMGSPGQSLHGLWDFFFIEHQEREWSEYAGELGARVRPVDELLWDSLDPVQWANESYQIVEDGVYREVERTGGYVGQLYFDQHIGTVERQLRKAGVRLALLLNTILDPDNGE